MQQSSTQRKFKAINTYIKNEDLKQFKFTPQDTRKEQTKHKISRRKELIDIKSK